MCVLGTLIFKEKGEYKGIWENGKSVNGNYYFNDGLKYENTWDYLTDFPYFYNEEINKNEIIYQKEKRNEYLDNIYDIGIKNYNFFFALIKKYIYIDTIAKI